MNPGITAAAWACLLISPAVTRAQVTPSGQTLIGIIGDGNDSCATWLTTATSKMLGSVWIQGYWSGRNTQIGVLNLQIPADVGHGTDAAGMLGEIEKVCRHNPSMKLSYAVNTVYGTFQQQGR